MYYPDRLRKLMLPTLAYRRIRGDMTEIYKLIHGNYDRNTSNIINLYNNNNNNNNNNTAFILRHISGHCGHSEAHYKHLDIINNIMIKMHTVKMQDKI